MANMRKCLLHAMQKVNILLKQKQFLQVLGKVLELHLSRFSFAYLPSAMKKYIGRNTMSLLLGQMHFSVTAVQYAPPIQTQKQGNVSEPNTYSSLSLRCSL